MHLLRETGLNKRTVLKYYSMSEKKCDIVLQNQGYNLTNIFKKKVNLKNIEIKNNSVGIIPNLRVVERVNPNEIYSIYKVNNKKIN